MHNFSMGVIIKENLLQHTNYTFTCLETRNLILMALMRMWRGSRGMYASHPC
jgi:hypothetical protein